MTFAEASKKGYKSLVWVRRCINVIGDALGSVPWKVYKQLPDGRLHELVNHSLAKLLNQPNPYFTRKEFYSALSAQLNLCGNSYIEIVQARKKPFEMYLLNPSWTKPVPDPVTYLSHYIVDPGAGITPVQMPVDDVLHFKYYDPENQYVGCSPISSARKTVDLEHAAITWNQGIFDNSAVPGGVLKVPANTLRPAERVKLKEEIETGFTKENIGKPMILWGGMEWESITLSQQDIEFLRQRQVNKYEICAVLGVAPQMVGANEDPTYANYDVARQSFWEDRIIPELDWLQIMFQNKLAPYFGDDLLVMPDISGIPALQKSFAQKVETARTMYTMGYPANELNRRLKLGMADLKWGDVWWAPMNMMPVDDADISQYVNNVSKDLKEGVGRDPYEEA
jgi:HK97 family phage portal protein